jgi:hypothetical protein
MPPPVLGSNLNYAMKTPPQRIFPELTGIAQYQQKKNQSVSFQVTNVPKDIPEQEVVEMVKKYKKGLLKIKEEKDKHSPSPGPSTLKKDNVNPSEVVTIINEQRKKEKESRSYQKLSWPLSQVTIKGKINDCLSPKVNELKAIFEENEMTMEWEKIADEVAAEEMKEQGAGVSKKEETKFYLDKASGDYRDWLKYHIQQKLVKRLEGHELIQKYMVLNQEFETRVKEENREKDMKNINDKRAQKSPKQSLYQKKRGVGVEEENN